MLGSFHRLDFTIARWIYLLTPSGIIHIVSKGVCWTFLLRHHRSSPSSQSSQSSQSSVVDPRLTQLGLACSSTNTGRPATTGGAINTCCITSARATEVSCAAPHCTAQSCASFQLQQHCWLTLAMASAPSQSSAPRRNSSLHAPSTSSHSPTQASDADLLQRSTHAPSATSIDSQTVLLNHPHSPTTPVKLDRDQERRQIQPATTATATATAASTTDDPRKCWICFTDETEDTPMSSEWRSPCPCALTAHESCLLDWIADLQAPSARRRSSMGSKILCPQCKAEITVARPHSAVVEAVTNVERAVGQLALPGIFAVLGGCLWTGCLVYGMNTVYVIFGGVEGDRILGRAAAGVASTPSSDRGDLLRLLNPFAAAPTGWSWRLGLGLPLVPPILVMSRTRSADSILPILPILFLATQGGKHEPLDLTHWPPSPSMTLAALPYVRGAYNEIYDRTFGEWEKQWAKEVQPRGGEGDDGEADAQVGQGQMLHDDEAGEGGEDVLIDVNVEIDIFDQEEEDEDGNQLEEAAPPAPQPAVGQAGADEGMPAPAPIPGQGGMPPPQRPAQAQRPNNLVISTGQLADTIIGALLFPTISSSMGALLKLVLPRSWTTPPAPWEKTKLGGLLQARWGRSIIGGCLFVVFKDAVLLYVRWKQAQGHRQRRVLDYDKAKGKVKGIR